MRGGQRRSRRMRRAQRACGLCAAMLFVAAATAQATDVWWDAFPRIVQTDNLPTGNAHHGDIAFIGALRDPGWGPYGQMITYWPWQLTQFQTAGFKSIGYYETFGQALTFVAEIDLDAPTDFAPMLHSHWNWQLYGGGDVVWVGVHNFFDDMAFARPYTRTHPRYSAGPMTYPDGTVASGFDGDPADPRNHHVFDAGCAKDILGGLNHTPGYNPTVNAIDPQSGLPTGPLDGLFYVPTDDMYAGIVSMSKDPACPHWIDFTYASTLLSADEGLDGMWTDNYSAWDGFGVMPVRAGFGDWSVARFRDFLAVEFTPTELAALGISDVGTFDIRAALRDQVTAWGGNSANLSELLWADPRWLDEPLWRAYTIFKRQNGHAALADYYTAVKTAAADAGIDDFLVCGNDIPVFSLGWVRGELDMVSTEVSAGWNLCSGPRGFMIPPYGRMAPFYKLAREHAQSRFVNVWLYTDGYETELTQTGVSTTMYYEMLATHTLPMFYPLASNPTVAGTWAGNTAFFDFVEQAAPELGARLPREEIGVYYSSSSALMQITPGGFRDHADQPHQFAHWGWSTALGSLHYQYRAVPEWKLTAETLAGLKLLIVPNAEVFEAAKVSDVLTPWVQAGGRLIVTGASGRRGGEDELFSVYAGGYSLAPLTGVSDVATAPATLTLPLGAGLVHYIRDHIGQTYFDASTSRPTLLPEFATALDTALAGTGPALVTAGAGVTANVGLTVYEDEAAGRLFVDVNNFAINVATDTIQSTAALTFTVQAPTWLETCSVQAQSISPQSPPPAVTVTPVGGGALEVSLDAVAYYASVVIEPTVSGDSDGDGVSDACDACPNTPTGTPVGADGCLLTHVDDTILFNAGSGATAGLWQASRTQWPPQIFYDGDPRSAGSAVLNDPALLPNPNTPLVGDVDGDGISDLVVAGYDAALDMQVLLGRLTGRDGQGRGDLDLPSPAQGWPDNAVAVAPEFGDFVLGDVDGDGRADAIGVRDHGDGALRWQAWHSDADGLSGVGGTSWTVAGSAGSQTLAGDFNGDGLLDVGQRLTAGTPGYVQVFLTPADGGGLQTNPPLEDVVQGATEDQPNRVATLVGDINADGLDDLVIVDDRFGDGTYVWVADLTAEAATPSGLALGAGGKSWAIPFGNSTPPAVLRIPLLADINGDGFDDLVEYREFADTVNAGGVRFGQWVVAYTDPESGNLFGSSFDDGATLTLGADEIDNVALVGNFTFVPKIEICTNGLDDDGDGLVDCEDAFCDAALICLCGSDPADLNGDRQVDYADFELLLECIDGPGVAGACLCADLDGDGDVDLADVDMWLRCVGGGCGV